MGKIHKKLHARALAVRLGRKLRTRICIDAKQKCGIRYKIVERKKELESACRLVHDRYVDKGYMAPREHGLRLSFHNALPETTTFIGKHHERVVYTMTLFQDSDMGLPMDGIYKKELDSLRYQGRKIAEVGSLATHPDIRSDDQTILMHGKKITLKYSIDHLGIDDLVIAINPKHQWFYEHIMLCEKIGDLKTYDYVNNAPAVAYRLNLKSVKERFRTTYKDMPLEKNLHHFLFKENSPSIELPEENQSVCFWDEEKIQYFFKEKTNLLYGADPGVCKCLHEQYDYLKSGWYRRFPTRTYGYKSVKPLYALPVQTNYAPAI